ncbi:MAG: dihydroneopterin aldolase [Hyphomicrobiaceae bacterium]|nr:dihydroneopterin aldolase [Hyphomicrobiaceae bacterium]
MKLHFYIGVLAEEKSRRQLVIINIWMKLTYDAPHVSDDISSYVSYAELIERIKLLSEEGQHIDLVETLAEKISNLAFLDSRITKVVVSVDKPDIIPEAESVGVIIYRSRVGVR